MRIGFRNCDPRFGFLWLSAAQPAARWHGPGEGPANYFADKPTGAWAEFLRHEAITDAADLAGVSRSLRAVELPDDGYVRPNLPDAILFGNEVSYDACQAAATPPCDGLVWVLYDLAELRGWLAVDGGAPPASILPLVRRLAP